MPDISILTTTLNAADTVEDCVRSIHSQSVDCEYIVVEGGSTDNTKDVLQEHSHAITKYLEGPGMGMYEALNKGISLSSGEIIGILNADDYYPDPDVLSQVLDIFRDEAIEACYGNLVYVDRNNTNRIVRYWSAGDYNRQKFYHGWMPPHPTFFVRRRVYEQYGDFRLDLGSAADYELMLRLLFKHQLNAAYIPDILVHMRTGGISNRGLSGRLVAHRMDRRAWEVNGLKPRPWTLLAKPLRKTGQWLIR